MEDSELREWAHLPEGIVHLISEKVKSAADHIRFRAVCFPWRSASLPKPHHLPPQLPWLIIPWDSRDKNDNGTRLFYDLWEAKMHKLHLPETKGMLCCASYHGWLLLAPIGGNKELLLLNPLTRLESSSRLLPLRSKILVSAGMVPGDILCCCVGDPRWTRVRSSLNPDANLTDATYYNGRFYLLCDGAVEVVDSNKPEEGNVYLFEQELDYVRMFLLERKSGVSVVGVHHSKEEEKEEEVLGFSWLLSITSKKKRRKEEDDEKCPKQRYKVYQYQEPFKLKQVADTSNTVFFCGSGVFPHLTVDCSDVWDFLDGGSMYMECVDLSFEGEERSELSYSIYIAKLDDGLFEPGV